jgi:NAD(P)-dependent dehydrogenase (short-subunit alcohol dehydrogenase family)
MERSRRVVVVTGIGGMGLAIARRLGAGSTLLLADVHREALAAAAGTLQGEGHEVVEHVTDVSDQASVSALATTAAELGRIEVLAHTAGLSPVQVEAPAILKVDLLGTALVLDAFGSVIASGGAGVCIASMAGTMFPVDPDLERRLATTPTSELLAIPELAADRLRDAGTAYGIAKRANQARVRAAAVAWGRRGARVNSLSPGIIATPMGTAELDGPNGDAMRQMIAESATGRRGTPDDIAGVVAFLVGPDASFVTGTDVLVDGGVIAALATG